MFIETSPVFTKGRILKKEMLAMLRDFPKHFTDIYFNEFSEGIISGANIVVSKDSLIVKKGILKKNNRLYILSEDYVIPYSSTGNETMLKVKVFDENITEDYKVASTQIILDENMILDTNQIELCRFKLKPHAYLRQDYQDLWDFTTEYNTVNIVNVIHSAPHKSTISPEVLRFFGREALKAKCENPYDISFSFECLNNGYMDRNIILYYISNRIGMEFREYTNGEIHKKLVQILEEVKRGGKGRGRGAASNSRILVD